jgi:hypothetical protein
MIDEHDSDLESLLGLLPSEDRPEAMEILKKVPYPATRLLQACRDGSIDSWELRTALRRMCEDCSTPR